MKNTGVRILLARMESHPEEFKWLFPHKLPVGAKWHDVMYIVMDLKNSFISEEDRKALIDKYATIQGEAFNEYVMEVLLHVDSPDSTSIMTDDKWPERTQRVG